MISVDIKKTFHTLLLAGAVKHWHSNISRLGESIATCLCLFFGTFFLGVLLFHISCTRHEYFTEDKKFYEFKNFQFIFNAWHFQDNAKSEVINERRTKRKTLALRNSRRNANAIVLETRKILMAVFPFEAKSIFSRTKGNRKKPTPHLKLSWLQQIFIWKRSPRNVIMTLSKIRFASGLVQSQHLRLRNTEPTRRLGIDLTTCKNTGSWNREPAMKGLFKRTGSRKSNPASLTEVDSACLRVCLDLSLLLRLVWLPP